MTTHKIPEYLNTAKLNQHEKTVIPLSKEAQEFLSTFTTLLFASEPVANNDKSSLALLASAYQNFINDEEIINAAIKLGIRISDYRHNLQQEGFQNRELERSFQVESERIWDLILLRHDEVIHEMREFSQSFWQGYYKSEATGSASSTADIFFILTGIQIG